MKHELTQKLGTGTKTVYQRAWCWVVLAIAAFSLSGAVTSGLAQTAWTHTIGSPD